VSPEDLPLVMRCRWTVHYQKGYANTQVQMHRMIMGVTDLTIHIDHKNGNRLDNR